MSSAIYPDGPRAPDGRIFTLYGPFQSILMVPVLILAKAISHGSPDTLSKLIFGVIVIPAVSALSMAILFRALLSFGYATRIALWTTIVIGFVTPMWHYARSGQEENIIGLAFSIYLLGMAQLFRARYGGLILVSMAASMVVATRWSYLPALAALMLPVAIRLWQRRSDVREWLASLGVALALGVGTICSVFWYNDHRFLNPFETGYGIYFRQTHEPFFLISHIPINTLALLVSPLRGLLWFCPTIVILCGLSRASKSQLVNQLWPFILMAWIFEVLLIASFSVWTGGFAWGPRYLIAPIVLLAPLFAAVFASGQRWRPLLAVSLVVQVCSVLLPSAAENYVYAIRNETRPGSCSPWTWECSAVYLRLPWSLRAIANTILARPLAVIDSESGKQIDSREVLVSSDYNSVYWWPVRAAFRMHLLSPLLALALCLAAIAAALYGLYAIYRKGRPDDDSEETASTSTP